ncbi:MAG: hypothetical protein EB127_25800 [Alphaproteobacteria bacterium]|nr:hypothetical protein [Alphaproteobacteria bacterium]
MSNPWEATELFGKMLGEYTDNGYRQGVYEERERIITLLQEKAGEYYEQALWTDADGLLDAIALIKGENE